jgi:hypothetical protein
VSGNPDNMTVVFFPLLVLVTAGVEVVAPDAGAPGDGGAASAAREPAAAIAVTAGEGPAARQHRSTEPDRRGTHELRDPADWPAEPPVPAGRLDERQFDAAVVALCDEVAPLEGLDALARLIREVSAETDSDPFLLAALVYRQGRCRPGL